MDRFGVPGASGLGAYVCGQPPAALVPRDVAAQRDYYPIGSNLSRNAEKVSTTRVASESIPKHVTSKYRSQPK